MGLSSKDILEIFELASELPEEERATFLEERCSGDKPAIEKISRLIQAHKKNSLSNYLEWPQNDAEISADHSQWLGTLVGQYRLIERLGEGSSGIVFLAETIVDKSASKPEKVAVKLLRGWKQDDAGQARFLREAEALSKLDHPSIVKLIEFGNSSDGTPYIVMPYIAGTDLWKKIRNGSQTDLPTKIAWFRNVCHAIAAAHQKLVVHRDLKPSNIIVTEDQSHNPLAVVTDFGTAKFVDEDGYSHYTLTTRGSLLGTPAFMAPEQTDEAAGDITLTTDIYGLGSLLYFLLTSQAPFESSNPFDLIDKVRKESPQAPRSLQPDIPKDLETICLKCLEKAPVDRYQSVPELLADLDRWEAGRPIEAIPVPLTKRAWYWCKSNPHIAVLSSILLIGLILGSITLTLLWQDAKVANLQLRKMIDALVELEVSHRDDLDKSLVRIDILTQITQAFEELKKSGTTELDSDLLKTSATAWYNLVRFKLNVESKLDEVAVKNALEQFKELATRHPHNLQFQFDFFHCNLVCQKHEEALEIIRDLVLKEPTNLDFADCLASSLLQKAMELNRQREFLLMDPILTESIDLSRKVLELCPDSRRAHFTYCLSQSLYWRSRCMYVLGEKNLAQQDLMESLRLGKFVAREIVDPGTTAHYCETLRWASVMAMFENDYPTAEHWLAQAESFLPDARKHASMYTPYWSLCNKILFQRWMLQFEQSDSAGMSQTAKELNSHFRIWETYESHLRTFAKKYFSYRVTQLPAQYDQVRIEFADYWHFFDDHSSDKLALKILNQKLSMARKQIDNASQLIQPKKYRTTPFPYFDGLLTHMESGNDSDTAPLLPHKQQLFLLAGGTYQQVFLVRNFLKLKSRIQR
ncbi:MAG: serine/threonine-protein kinase [Planctomycetota bacterium]